MLDLLLIPPPLIFSQTVSKSPCFGECAWLALKALIVILLYVLPFRPPEYISSNLLVDTLRKIPNKMASGKFQVQLQHAFTWNLFSFNSDYVSLLSSLKQNTFSTFIWFCMFLRCVYLIPRCWNILKISYHFLFSTKLKDLTLYNMRCIYVFLRALYQLTN